MNLGHGVTTGPILLAIFTEPSISLEMLAGLYIPVPGQAEPLLFNMGMKLNLVSMSIEAFA